VPSDPARPLSCAVYTRQSVKTESDLTSCEVQRDLCVQFLQRQRRQGLRLKLLNERFDDEGVSGASLDRPALQRVLALVRTKKVDGVVVHRLDRLSRRVLDCTALLEGFKQIGTRLFVASMPDLTGGAYDTLLLNLLSTFAEFEREMIASRIAERRAGLVARGRRIAGAVPFGYTADPESKQLVQVEREASVLREMFELVAAGVLPSEVASVAEEKGWRTRTGRPWTARQVLDTVANPVYSGRFRTPDGTRPGAHEAIVHQDTFDQCARIIAGRRTRGPGPRSRRKWSPIEGKVRCTRCGRLMGIHTVRNGCVLYCYFRCRSTAGGQRPCTGTQVPVAQIETQVRSIFLAPGEHLHRQRGRPTRAIVTLFSLGEVLPMLDPATEQKLIHDVVQEIVWDSAAGKARVSLNTEALERLQVVRSVCTPVREYPRSRRRSPSRHDQP